ncbi:TetR/AcrR family transcriptional regulator [Gordonia bronchialis]|uniref:TetR/AcrR family transcriptional regulator n=1 Tax=Gordonia bronchialis TaxID=2054 RepID=UPI0024309C12|nr:TetR family transcriptional regulator [Gordonia bronchialis]
MVRSRGRPVGRDVDKRAAILSSSREMFSAKGFERTTIRAIASDAGVDPALVHHYFGTKDNLLVEALKPDIDMATYFAGIDADEGSVGTEFIRRVLTVWTEQPTVRNHLLAMLRISLSHDGVAARLRDAHIAMVTIALGDQVAPDDRERRLALIGTVLVGLGISRYILCVPALADATPDEIAARVGPVIDSYLRGAAHL